MILYAEVECMLYEGNSLKEKRSVLKRLMNNLRSRFNIAVTELDYHDLWQRTKFGIVTVSNDSLHAEKVMQEVLKTIDAFSELERTITNMERL